MNNFANERELLDIWLKKMANEAMSEYKEPLLDEFIVKSIHQFCEVLKQDVHVFITAVEILEDYLKKKCVKNDPVADQCLTTTVAIFIASKLNGELADLRIAQLERFLFKITGRNYSSEKIKSVERDFIQVLNGHFPIHTVADDLQILLEKFQNDGPVQLTMSLHILKILYMTRRKWFFELKNLYLSGKLAKENLLMKKSKSASAKNSKRGCLDPVEIFPRLMRSKCYLSVGIILSCIYLSDSREFLNLENIVDYFSHLTGISAEHLNILAYKIVELIHNYSDFKK